MVNCVVNVDRKMVIFCGDIVTEVLVEGHFELRAPKLPNPEQDPAGITFVPPEVGLSASST